ncbi:MAG: glutathione S-transferase family protein [Myxococcales bacterium]|nr:glutathione S-transferase family protein [Myxococcales bacterium]
MSRLKLSYFDFNGGRGEVARLAMSLGGVPFEDHRIPVADWPSVRNRTPFHAVPLLEVDGEVITQSNAINRFVGKLANLYPDDPLQAARCDEVMDAVEDVVTRVVATFGIEDESEKRAARETLVEGPMRLYLEKLQEMLVARGGSYFADDRLTVADLKVYVWIRSLRSGILDHVPPDLTDRVAPRLVEHCDRLSGHPGIVAYYDTH